MAMIDDLIVQISDPELCNRISKEVSKLTKGSSMNQYCLYLLSRNDALKVQNGTTA